MITKDESKITTKGLNAEIFSLNPSALISLFEIDISDIIFNKGLIDGFNSGNESSRIFRFHNNVNLFNTDIVWQGNLYKAAPIKTEGFELSSRGTLPTPKISLAVNTDGIIPLSIFKNQLRKIGDLSGAKVTRIRTLLKYLDAINFEGGVNDTEDSGAEFPRDIYYIDKKSLENKSIIEFELASLLDVEGIKLPGRLVIANRCTAIYRGEGCLYESKLNREEEIHGSESFSSMPTIAPAIANSNDEKITDLLNVRNRANPRGEWKRNTVYNFNDEVWIKKDKIRYYFVAKISSFNNPPPDGSFWIADQCSKLVSGCKLRWGTGSPGQANGNPYNSCLPINAYPGANKLR